MRVIITGATSMLGGAVIEECLAHGAEVVALVRKNSPKIARLPKSPRLTLVEAELTDLHSVQIDLPCDVFYHFAWDGTSKETRDDPQTHLNNVQYTLDAVGLAHRLGCRKFIGAGSQAEYGIYSGKIYPDTRVEPILSYGIAKYAAGKLSRKICDRDGITHIWTRIFSVYGEHDSENTMIQYALRQFRAGKPAQFSAATQKWNYLYEKDAGKIFYLLGEKDVPSGVYCVASDDTRPLKEFILEMKDVCGNGAKCEFAPPSEVPAVSLDPDITSLVNAIGWRPQTSFREGIRKILVHMINDGGWWILTGNHAYRTDTEVRYAA